MSGGRKTYRRKGSKGSKGSKRNSTKSRRGGRLAASFGIDTRWGAPGRN